MMLVYWVEVISMPNMNANKQGVAYEPFCWLGFIIKTQDESAKLLHRLHNMR